MDDVLSKEWKDDVIHMKNTQIERMHHVFFKTRFTFFVDQLFSGICLLVTSVAWREIGLTPFFLIVALYYRYNCGSIQKG